MNKIPSLLEMQIPVPPELKPTDEDPGNFQLFIL